MGFLNKSRRALKKNQEEKEAKVKAFLEEYKALSQRHGLDISAGLEYTEQGIRPIMRIVEIKKPEETKK